MQIDLLGGAFIATFQKGSNGKMSWVTNPNPNHIVVKKKEVHVHEKEKPQFAIVDQIENNSKQQYQEVLCQSTLEIAQYLKTL